MFVHFFHFHYAKILKILIFFFDHSIELKIPHHMKEKSTGYVYLVKNCIILKIFWQFLWNCKVIFNSSPFLKKKNFSQSVKHGILHFEVRITYFNAKIFWQPHADLIAWFEMESVIRWIYVEFYCFIFQEQWRDVIPHYFFTALFEYYEYSFTVEPLLSYLMWRHVRYMKY